MKEENEDIEMSLTRKLIEEELKFKKIMLISEESFMASITNPIRVEILKLLVQKPLKVSEIAKILRVSRPLIYKHLAYLEESGWVEKHEKYYMISSELFLVYRASQAPSGSGVYIEILSDKAAFIDHRRGLIVIIGDRGLKEICGGCVLMEICNRKIYVLAKRYKIDLGLDGVPVEKIIEFVNKYISSHAVKYLSKSYIVIRR
ncbi:MAG: winged helix-turn-helix domain-containing protein [Sulfolobales archaeon]